MKYLSENIIIDAWNSIIEIGDTNRVALNKFFGILELLQRIELDDNSTIISNFQYNISSRQLSNSLQEKYFFDDNNLKSFSSNESLNIIFPHNWIDNIFQIFLRSHKLPLTQVAIICLQNEVLENDFKEKDLVNLFLDKMHLNVAADIFFDKLSPMDMIFSETKPNRKKIFVALKKHFNLTDNTKFTIGLDKTLIAANPGELARGPFIQPLYSGQENLKCILLANFNLLEYYEINSIYKRIAKGKTLNPQTIFFGSPGTGKSHKADDITNGNEVQKVTFHPDYDYHSFVGGYKPTMDGDKIAYKFVPQIFTKIYVNAWKNLESGDDAKPFYLQIEEINRGNCAEIFGDLFQLLDRKLDGSSKYEVTAEEELYKYLISADGFGGDHEGIKDGKLRFPSNLKIIATMNTSDQSLFPMDSAFKRRWDWIYVPIDTDCKFSDFTIQLDNGKVFEWLSFLKIINEEIFEITKSQDKQIGNWFIDAQNSGKVISESTFVNKVIFYLWNDVFKDEENTIFKSVDDSNLTYTSFFENGTANNLVSYILEERLKLTDLNKAVRATTGEE